MPGDPFPYYHAVHSRRIRVAARSQHFGVARRGRAQR
jgi:hypothetical protein